LQEVKEKLKNFNLTVGMMAPPAPDGEDASASDDGEFDDVKEEDNES
jgi:hypothetical protein